MCKYKPNHLKINIECGVKCNKVNMNDKNKNNKTMSVISRSTTQAVVPQALVTVRNFNHTTKNTTVRYMLDLFLT